MTTGTKLSVNINKIATLRNARGGDMPNLLQAALACEKYGAQGITVHPRPDERHIRYKDVYDLKQHIRTELNIEGNCMEPKFVQLVLENKPAQVTLVPDDRNQITSNHGWDTIKHKQYLQEMIKLFQEAGIRTSIFVDPIPEMIVGAGDIKPDRIELYTEDYAAMYSRNAKRAIKPYIDAAKIAQELQLGLNAGHDLSLENLSYFSEHIPGLREVSIGHALISDALYFGLHDTIKKYLNALA